MFLVDSVACFALACELLLQSNHLLDSSVTVPVQTREEKNMSIYSVLPGCHMEEIHAPHQTAELILTSHIRNAADRIAEKV